MTISARRAYDNIFVVGDCAAVNDSDGKQLPGVAAVAKQQGAYAARAIKAALNNEALEKRFAYVDVGNLATVGRKAAVVDFGAIRFTGFIGWVFWSVAHIYFLIGFKNRIAVALDWVWSYLTFERGARLITGDIEAPAKAVPRSATPPDTRQRLQRPAQVIKPAAGQDHDRTQARRRR